MLEKVVLNFILQDIPEGIIVTMFCFVFLNLRFRWKQIIIIAILLSLINVDEILPVALGIRTLILMIAYWIFVKIFTRKDTSKVFFAVLVAFLVNIAADSVWWPLLLSVAGLSYTYVYNIPYLRALFSYPTLLTILVASYFLYRYKKKKMINFE